MSEMFGIKTVSESLLHTTVWEQETRVRCHFPDLSCCWLCSTPGAWAAVDTHPWDNSATAPCPGGPGHCCNLAILVLCRCCVSPPSGPESLRPWLHGWCAHAHTSDIGATTRAGAPVPQAPGAELVPCSAEPRTSALPSLWTPTPQTPAPLPPQECQQTIYLIKSYYPKYVRNSYNSIAKNE